ncbi:hypothetical protein J3B02_005515, partial [Coemansia erecta]
MMDSESQYWAQYDEDFDYIPQGPAAITRSDDYAQSISLAQNARQPTAFTRYRQLAEPAVSDYPSSRDSYWSRYFGNASSSDQSTPLGDGGSARASTGDMRRLLVMPDRLASLGLGSSSQKSSAASATLAVDARQHGSRSDHAENKEVSSSGQSSGGVTTDDTDIGDDAPEAVAVCVDNARAAQPMPAAARTIDIDLQRQSSGRPGPCGTTAAGYGG